MIRPTRDEWAMGVAWLTASRSTCLRRQVGCVLLDKDGYILSTGFNGVAAGQPHCNEPGTYWQPVTETFLKPAPTFTFPHACPGHNAPSGTNLEGCGAIHAEQNALLRCRDVREIDTCYVTASPCMHCVKMLLNTGCRSIVFSEEYTHPAAKALWVGAGRFWDKYSEEEA